jgi:ADP-heptose:LPS heptosyltransferase
VSKKTSILIYRIGSLGDTLVTLPSIDFIRKTNPEKKIFLLTNYNPLGSIINSYTIYNELNLFDGVIKYDIKKLRTLNGLITLIQQLDEIRDFEFINLNDKVLRYNFIQRLQTKLFFKFIIKPIKLYNYNYNFQDLHPFKKNDKTYYSPEWYQISKFINPKINNHFYKLALPYKDSNNAMLILKNFNVKIYDPFIIIAPGSKMKAKLWRVEKYIDLTKKLLSKYPLYKIILIGDNNDSSICTNIIEKFSHTKNLINLSGLTKIYETAYIISKSRLFVGSDSGPMHFSGLLNIPCVALFSSRDVKGRWEPYGFNHTIIRKEIDCQYCMLETCPKNNECLNKITSDEVFNEITKYLD